MSEFNRVRVQTAKEKTSIFYILSFFSVIHSNRGGLVQYLCVGCWGPCGKGDKCWKYNNYVCWSYRIAPVGYCFLLFCSTIFEPINREGRSYRAPSDSTCSIIRRETTSINQTNSSDKFHYYVSQITLRYIVFHRVLVFF